LTEIIFESGKEYPNK